MKKKAPHIIVFLTDDHGHWASSPYGNQEVMTPAMLSLAQRGLVMDKAYTPSPVCSPARACFWTGKYPSAHGVHDWLGEPNISRDHPTINGQTNLAQLLKEQGYQTALVGKWHLNDLEQVPGGFDDFCVPSPHTNARFTQQLFIDNGKRREEFGHQSTHITDRAIEIIRQKRSTENPLFLFVGFTDTHTPHQPHPGRWYEHYLAKDLVDPFEPFSDCHGKGRFLPSPDPEKRKEQLAAYYASASMIDSQIGRILDELDNQQMNDDTMIVVTSDHGHMNGQHGLHTKGNATFPVNFLEESIRVPLILAGPSIPRAQRNQRMVTHPDLFATLLEAAGATPPQGLPGKSFLNNGEAAPSDPETPLFAEYGPSRMVRKGPWKLVVHGECPAGKYQPELYHLGNDPGERENLFGKDPANESVVQELTGLMEAFFQRYSAPGKSGLLPETWECLNNTSPWILPPDKQTVIYQ